MKKVILGAVIAVAAFGGLQWKVYVCQGADAYWLCVFSR